MNKIYKTYGTLKYDPVMRKIKNPWWALLMCDEGLSSFYRHLTMLDRTVTVISDDWLLSRNLFVPNNSWKIKIPYARVIRPDWGTHVSVVRGEKPLNESAWKKYNNKRFKIIYNPEFASTNGKHWWFRIKSPELEELRLELGLSRQPTYFDKLTGEKKYNYMHLTYGKNIEPVLSDNKNLKKQYRKEVEIFRKSKKKK